MPTPAPPKMFLSSLVTGDVLEAQYNPTELDGVLSVNWNELDVLGLSHMPMQYKNTANHRFEFLLRFNAISVQPKVPASVAIETGAGNDFIIRAHNLLHSWCYRQRGAQSIAAGMPHRVLFAWPGFISITAVIAELGTKYTKFSRRGRPTRMEVRVQIKEARLQRIFSEDVKETGFVRSGVEEGA